MTRAGPGIGRAVASALLSNGYQVALAGRRADKLKQIIEETGPGERALVVATDLADPGAVAALFAATVKRYGRLDLLFNNAGTAAHSASVEDLTDCKGRETVDTNLGGAFWCLREAFRVVTTPPAEAGGFSAQLCGNPLA